MANESLALTSPDPTLTTDSLRTMMEAAKRYVDSGLLPAAIKTPQQALTIMQVGREIGVPPLYALRNIHVIEGKPGCSAELLMALVRRKYGQSAIRVGEATNESCTVEYREAGWDGVSSLTFSIEDAKKALLADKPMWKKYPRAMLRSRAVGEAVRTGFPECIAGLYPAEELGADVVVMGDGSVEVREAIEGKVVVSPKVDAAARLTGAPLADEADPKPTSAMDPDWTPDEQEGDGEFHYGDVRERYTAAAEYDRLARLAVERGHKHAARIKAKHPKDMSDQELAVAVDKLQRWEKSLPPVKELVDAF